MKNLKRSQIAVMNIQYKFFPLIKFFEDAVANKVQCIELWELPLISIRKI